MVNQFREGGPSEDECRAMEVRVPTHTKVKVGWPGTEALLWPSLLQSIQSLPPAFLFSFYLSRWMCG